MRYKLADTVFEIDTLWPATHRLLADYRTDAPADFRIKTERADAEAERTIAEGKRLSDAYFETLAVQRKVSHALLEKDVLLFHGSAISMDGAGYIFTAPSGTGKSTHARLWRERYGDRVSMVNDDKPFLKIADSGAIIYGSPWDGKHRLSSNVSVPLRGIAILVRAKENRIERIDPSEALTALMRQSYREEDVAGILPLILKLAELVPIYRLHCNLDVSAAETAYEGMSETTKTDSKQANKEGRG